MQASRGSQKWLQIGVNQHPEVLNKAIREATQLDHSVTIEWLSPLAEENYVEYRDRAFLDRLKVKLNRTLFDFWPPRGPMWDGLARLSNGEVVLIEAKAHIAEMVSPASKASPSSLALIEKGLAETRKALAPKSTIPWSGTFYQYANRLAHLYFLRILNRVPARLVFLYFTGAHDVSGPNTREEWEGAIKVTEVYLGLGRHKLSRYVHHCFVDVREMQR